MEQATGVIAGYYGGSSRGSLPGWFLALMFGILAVLIFSGWYWSKASRIKRMLRDARPYPIASLPDSTVGKLIGKAEPIAGVLKSPIGGRACVYYIATVSTIGKYARVVAREERGVPFALVDPTGRALIDPSGAELVLDSDFRSTSGSFDPPSVAEAAFLERHRESSKGWIFNRALAFTEQTIQVGERIAVLGAGVREPDPEARPESGYRDAPPMRLRLTSSSRLKLHISDSHDTFAA